MNETLRAAMVIARRDFSAVVLSKTFILFLIGPLFLIAVGVLAGGIGERMARTSGRAVVGVVLPSEQADRVEAARATLAARLGDMAVPLLRRFPADSDPAVLLKQGDSAVAMLSGSLAVPELTGKAADVTALKGEIGLIVSAAQSDASLPEPHLSTRVIAESGGAKKQDRLATGQGAQALLFFLTMLLAGMVLSNMVEEKTNKIIEILAAAVPVDAIFLGKLIAMLGMSLTGIAIWGGCGAIGTLLIGGAGAVPTTPAVGWPLFILLGIVYFSTAYTLLGALFIGIGSQAATVREVQTLSMPITLSQVVIFFLTTSTVDQMGSWQELLACVFPVSSPFAMIARAAQSPAIWPHVLAIGWQLLWVGLIVRVGVMLFRRNVLKSGAPRRSLLGRMFRRRQGAGV